MKRPLFIAAVLVLSGIICGVKESGISIKSAAIIVAVGLVYLLMSGYFEEKDPLFSVQGRGKKHAHSRVSLYSYREREYCEGDKRHNEKSYHEKLCCEKRLNDKADTVRLRQRLLLSLTACAVFAAGFLRGVYQSHIYNTPECEAFYDYYRPTNPGLFDYSLYLKSLDISSREEYEAYRNSLGKATAASGAETAKSASTSFFSHQAASADSASVKALADGTSVSSIAASVSQHDELSQGSPQAINDETAPIILMLNEVKEHCAGLFDSSLSEHDASIYKAVILGDKTDMDMSIRDLYQDAGIAHLLAVSGLHVSMIGASLYNILRRRLSARQSAAAVTPVLFCYMLMTGASGSVIRAVIMLILNIFAAVFGRNYCMTTAISASAIAIMFYRPYMIFTSGFQLSFGAVASISLIAKSIIRRMELLRENSVTTDISQADLKKNTDIWHKLRERFKNKLAKKEDDIRRNENASLVKYVNRSNKLSAPLSAFIVSASIQLGTLPMIAYHFYKVPVYGILLNFIVIPLMAAVIASGLALIGIGTLLKAAASASIWTGAAAGLGIFAQGIRLITAIAAAPGHYVLKIYEILSAFTLKLPYASVCIGRPSVVQIIIYYCILAAVILIVFRPRRVTRGKVRLLTLAVLILFIANASVLRYRNDSRLCIMSIDVGQGDSFLIRNDDSAIIIDGGSSSRSNIGKYVIEGVLMAQGIMRLDAVIVSHADADHVNGIEYLLSDESDISTDVLVLPAAARQDADYDDIREVFLFETAEVDEDDGTVNNNSYGSSTDDIDNNSNNGGNKDINITKVTNTAAAGDRRIIYPAAGSNICTGSDFRLSCLYEGAAGDDKNRQSLVLLLESGDFTMLFTGDTKGADERIFTDEAYLRRIGAGQFTDGKRLTILKAAHHGSHTANTEAVFDAFSPQAVLISCGQNNRYGHPHEEVVERAEASGSRILRTDESGAISIYVDGQSIRIERYKQLTE